MTAKLAVVGGARGFIGRAVCARLKCRGYDIVTVTRQADQGTTWEQLQTNGLPTNTQLVINLAGRTIGDPLSRWTDAYKNDVWSSRIDTTKTLVNAIERSKQKPKLFLSASAIGYYSPSTTHVYTESDQGYHDPDNWFSRLCGAWESAAKLNEDNNVTRQCTLRFGVVLGRDGGIISNIYTPFFLGLGGSMGSGAHWLSWVHIDDLIGIIEHLIDNESINGAVNVVAPNPVQYNEFVRALATAMARPAFCNTPTFVVRLLFGAERADQLILASQRVQPKVALETGYKFKYKTVNEACEEIVKRK